MRAPDSLMPKAMPRDERDACAIVAFIDKRGHSTHANIVRTIDALRKMGHRSGDINGEGDGCGIVTDIPREIWSRRLAGLGLSPHLAESAHFFVGHLLLPGQRPLARIVSGFGLVDVQQNEFRIVHTR